MKLIKYTLTGESYFYNQNCSMCENRTQTLLNNYWNSLNIDIHPQEGNKDIFGSLKPDGWFIDDEIMSLFIFEAKRTKKQFNDQQTRDQILKYIETCSNYADEHELNICPVFVCGTTNETFKMYYIDDTDNWTLKELAKVYQPQKMKSNIKKIFDPHVFNQWIYDNFDSISSDEKLLIVVSVLLTKYTTSPEQLKPPLFMRILETERAYGMENEFEFIKHEPYITCINELFKYFENIDKNNIVQHLYDCFVEISIWSFKEFQGKSKKKQQNQDEGAVMTPPDIVNLMINSLDIKPTDSIYDPCCGIGNFLLEAFRTNKTNLILGNEFNKTRYIIAKHGMLILGIESPNITLGDCMKQEYNPMFDWLLMNPPYGGSIQQRFCLKFIKQARKGGAIIIPLADFQNVAFQKQLAQICHLDKLIILNDHIFFPVNTIQPAILIFTKSDSSGTQDGFKLFDYRNDGAVYPHGLKDRIITRTDLSPVYVKDINDEVWRIIEDPDYNDEELFNGYLDYAADIICSQIKINAQHLKQSTSSTLKKKSINETEEI